jgi:hypothetical protein
MNGIELVARRRDHGITARRIAELTALTWRELNNIDRAKRDLPHAVVDVYLAAIEAESGARRIAQAEMDRIEPRQLIIDAMGWRDDT